jgi:23S rRNA (cytidine1920-2'-O)/16S rRNA (cytidine1409-2'-O)-methyltransferase
VLLVKPQFEAGREAVGGGGVVRDAAVWREAIVGVADALVRAGADPLGVIASPITGPAGNVEFLLHARAGSPGDGSLDVDAAVRSAQRLVTR